MLRRETVDEKAFNPAPLLPFELRVKDFELAMQDLYGFFFDVNTFLLNKGLLRLDDMLRPAIMSGVLSDMYRLICRISACSHSGRMRNPG